MRSVAWTSHCTLNVLTTTNGGNYIFPLARSGPVIAFPLPPPQPSQLTPSLSLSLSPSPLFYTDVSC